MSTYNYPQTVYLVDAKHKDNTMPLSLNLIGEASITRNVDGKNEESKVILALENTQWYDIEFIENNYK